MASWWVGVGPVAARTWQAGWDGDQLPADGRGGGLGVEDRRECPGGAGGTSLDGSVSSGLVLFSVRPSDVGVVGGAGFYAAVQDANEAVGELS